MRQMKIVCACIIALAVLGTRAEASAIIFTDRDAFNAAAQPNARVGFDEPGHVSCDFNAGCPPFLVFDDGLFRLREDFEVFSSSSTSIVNGQIVLNSLTIGGFGFSSVGTTVPSLGIGFDVTPVGGPITLTVIAGTSPFLTFALNAPQFLGFLFDEPSTQLGWAVSPPNFCPGLEPQPGCRTSVAVIDNITLRTVPEPATAILFTAATAVFLARRRVITSRP
jgi:hypothetical protein